MNEKYTEEYNALFDQFESLLNTTPFNLDTDFKFILSEYKKEEQTYNILSSKLVEIETRLNSYEKMDVELPIDICEIVEKLSITKESVKRYNSLTEKLSMISVKDLEDQSVFISDTKKQMESYEQKIEQYQSNIKELEIWKKNEESNKKYVEISETIQKSKHAKEYLMEEVKCYEKL